MTESIPPNFDPRINDKYEFVPYDIDPAVQGVVGEESQTARDLGQRLRAWQDATHEMRFRPDDAAAQISLRNAELNLEDYLTQLGINRSVREKQPPQE